MPSAIATASAPSSNGMAGWTGPKTSSCAGTGSGAAPVSSVGATQGPPGGGSPDVAPAGRLQVRAEREGGLGDPLPARGDQRAEVGVVHRGADVRQRAATRSATSAARLRPTTIREAAERVWPAFRRPASTSRVSAASASEDDLGRDLPPSPGVTGTASRAAAARTGAPAAGGPVKGWRAPGWPASAAPASAPVPGTTFEAPARSPARDAISAKASAVGEASSAGLSTPMAGAAPAERPTICIGVPGHDVAGEAGRRRALRLVGRAAVELTAAGEGRRVGAGPGERLANIAGLQPLGVLGPIRPIRARTRPRWVAVVRPRSEATASAAASTTASMSSAPPRAMAVVLGQARARRLRHQVRPRRAAGEGRARRLRRPRAGSRGGAPRLRGAPLNLALGSPRASPFLADAGDRAMPGWMSGLLGRGRRAAPRASGGDWPPRPAGRISGGDARAAPASEPPVAPSRRGRPSAGGFAEGVARFAAAERDGAPLPAAEPDALDRGLAELDARLPPPGVEARPAGEPRALHRRSARLGADAAAGGGLVRGPDGEMRPHYWGHRERLRRRFLEGGQEAMPEYELLELLLFDAIPRVDVKPLAKRLLAAFGDLGGVVSAPERRLLAVEGATPRVHLQLRIAEAFAHRMARARVIDRCAIASWDDLLRYCKTVMAHRSTEQVRVLYLDRKNVLIADEAQGEGTVDHVPVYPREVVRRALELNASAVILVHNHPSGDPEPSQEDVAMTARIEEACRAVGVVLHDHLVIGRDRDASLRAMGLM